MAYTLDNQWAIYDEILPFKILERKVFTILARGNYDPV
jgi:hypothetical protein